MEKSTKIRISRLSCAGTPVRDMLVSFYRNVGCRRIYYLPVLLFACLSLGFSVFNRTLSVDDLTEPYYNGEKHGMIAGMRWGMTLWNRLMVPSGSDQMMGRLLAAIFLVAAAVLLACLMYNVNGRDTRNIWQYTLCSSMFVSYPLICEIWEYNGANFTVYGDLVLVLLALMYQLSAPRVTWKTALAAGAILAPVMASYEAGIFAYISLVLIILFLEEQSLGFGKKKDFTWMGEGLCYAAPVAVSLVLRLVIGGLLLAAYGLRYTPNGSTGVYWEGSLAGAVARMIGVNGLYYGVNGLVYLPITVFVAAEVFFAVYVIRISVREKRLLPVVMGIFIVVSLFFQAIIQGVHLPYRTAQTVHIFCAFAAYLAVHESEGRRIGRADMRRAATVLLLLLCLKQSTYLDQILMLNNQRSDNEAAAAQQIGFRLVSEFDSEKPVYFAGNTANGEWIESMVSVDEDTLRGRLWNKAVGAAGISGTQRDRLSKFVCTDVQPSLGWFKGAFGSPETMKAYFSYYGYDLNIPTEYGEVNPVELEQLAVEQGMKQYEIRDMGEYILVYLGDAEAYEE